MPSKNVMAPSSTFHQGALMPKVAILILFLGAGVVTGGFAWSGDLQIAPGATVLTATAPGPTEQIRTGQVAELRERVTVVPEVGEPDALSILEEHWGAEWPAVRDELFGGQLDQASLPQVLLWKQAKDMHRSAYQPTSLYSRDVFFRMEMSWPGRQFSLPVSNSDAGYEVLSAESLARFTGRYELANMDQATIARIDSDLESINQDLDRNIHAFMDALDNALAIEFESGGLVRSPVKRRAIPRDESVVYSKTASGGGWKSRVAITADRYPYVADLKDQIRALRKQRDSRLDSIVEDLIKG
jgi:hypothetical protein